MMMGRRLAGPRDHIWGRRGARALSPTAPLADFPNEAQAQQHCPGDTFVWLHLLRGVYHFRGQR